MKTCPFCGTELINDCRFCTECGKPIPQGKVCPQCGSPVNNDDSFCQSCGHRINVIEKRDSLDRTSVAVSSKSSFNKNLLFVVITLVLAGTIWYGFKTILGHNREVDMSLQSLHDEELIQSNNSQIEKDTSIIKEWYDYVFGVKEISDNVLNKFLSPDTKKRLWTEDYEGTYEYWRFRTTAQDYNPEVGDISRISKISIKGDGWYDVSYLDMGSKGKTKVRIANNKIIDFVQDSTWDSWDTPTDRDNQSVDYSTSTTENTISKEQLIFLNAQYIVGHLLNQRFRHSSGLEIRFDGDARMYIDGDPAGVISVLRHDRESAIIRYGNGMYGEGKLFMQYANGKIQLTDTADGSVFYQK